jgi:hypothetical protein
MFIIKLLLKVILLPVFLMVCFIRTWVEVLSKIGCVILGLFYLAMLAIIVMYISMRMWDAALLGVVFSFVAFIFIFGSVAVGVVIEDIINKIGNILTS